MIIEYFQSNKDGKWRVKIVGRNGERYMLTQAYASKGNSKRSANRLGKATGWEVREGK